MVKVKTQKMLTQKSLCFPCDPAFFLSFYIAIRVCLKIGYIPNYSHLIGIMIINPTGLGVLTYFQTHPYIAMKTSVFSSRSRRGARLRAVFAAYASGGMGRIGWKPPWLGDSTGFNGVQPIS